VVKVSSSVATLSPRESIAPDTARFVAGTIRV
jgi:hypothetical protein